jgi:hypothetical protein
MRLTYAIYDLVARNCYRWFGRRDACILPNSDHSWAIVNRPENAVAMVPGAGRHDEGSSVTAIQLGPRRKRAVKGTWPRRSPERGRSDRLFLSQARRLQFSQVWYERALKADPNHVLTWQ